MRTMHVVPLLSIAFALLNGSLSSAQNAQAARIVEKIDEHVLVTLRGNTLPVANAQTDSGRVRPDLAMTDLVLVLTRSQEQQAAFDNFVASQYDPSSPNFHHWLEPAEVGEKFGPSLADIATVSNWLTSHGLTIDGASKDRMAIRFGGSAAQVEGAFHTEVHNIQVNGQKHIANMSDPLIPAALAPVVMGLKALNDFHPRPMHKLGSKVQFDSSTGMWQRAPDNSPSTLANAALSKSSAANPEFGITVSTQGGPVPLEDVTPWDFATIYNVLPLWNAGTPIDGTGQTIAIVATSDINPADVASYRSVFGLPAGPPLQIIIANGVDPGRCTAQSGDCTIGDLYENTLDAEVSGAVAKGAQIDLVVSGPSSPTTDTVYSSASYIVENNTAKIMSLSYGLCELFLGTSGNAAYNNLFETAAVEGIGASVSTGDSGSPSCDQGLDSSVPYGAQFGLSVSGIASTPYVTAVGGTDFAWCKPTVTSSGQVIGCSTVTPYWNTTNNATTGASAAGYVPEIPWNDSCASSLTAAYGASVATFLKISGVSDPEQVCNFIVNNFISIRQQYGVDLSSFVDSVGGGGGASNCTVNSTTDSTTTPDPTSCSGGYSKPSWQAGVAGIPSDGKRDIPDVSFFSGNGLWNSATIVCVSEVGACVSSTSTTTEPIAQEVGGTSVAAPEMAGVMALINQKAGSAQGNPNAELYALAAKQTYSNCSAETVATSSSCYFNDVNTSTNAMPCNAGALNCTVSHTGDTWGILSGFSATTGFDEATGLGSLNVANVVNNWGPIGGTAAATVTVTPSQNTIAINQSLTVMVSVAGSSGTPTGNVGLVSSGYTGTAGALSSGSFTFTIPAESLTAGTDALTISYGGDSTYAEASGSASVTVTKLTPTVTVAPTPSTVGANTPVSVMVTVSGAGPTPTGTVTLSGGGYTSSACTLNNAGNCSIAIPANSFSNGTDTLTVSYSGDQAYTFGSGTATVTVQALTPAVTVTPSSSSISSTSTLQVVISVAGSGAVPTGTVQLIDNVTHSLGSMQLSSGSATFSVQASILNTGSNNLVAVYSGDSTYLGAQGTATVTMTKLTPTMTAVPASTSLYTNAALVVTGSVSGTGPTPTGSVSLSSGNYSTGNVNLSAGSYSITIPAGSLSVGTDTLTVSYSGDTFYNSVSTTTAVSVAQFVKVAPTVAVTPAASSIDTAQSLSVTVAVAGSSGTPTGTVQLTGGGYTSTVVTLSNGSATFNIPPNTLSAGTVSLSANYSGDTTYLAATQSSSITVTQSVFSIAAGTATPASVAKGGSATSTITVASSTNYGGTATLSCTLTSGPTNQAGDSPTCSVPTGSFSVGQTTTATVGTSAATSSALTSPMMPGRNRGLASGATALALLILCGIPARRRSWRSMLGLVVILIALGCVSACGGGGGGGGNPGTASGAYTFTVTGTGNPAVTPAPTATFTVTVN